MKKRKRGSPGDVSSQQNRKDQRTLQLRGQGQQADTKPERDRGCSIISFSWDDRRSTPRFMQTWPQVAQSSAFGRSRTSITVEGLKLLSDFREETSSLTFRSTLHCPVLHSLGSSSELFQGLNVYVNLHLFSFSVRHRICMRTATPFIVTQTWPPSFILSLNKTNKGIACY